MKIRSFKKNSKDSLPATKPILDLNRTVIRHAFKDKSRPWNAIPNIRASIRELGRDLPYDEYDEISDGIWVHVSAYLAPNAKIEAPAIICGGARLCNHTYVTGSVIGAFSTVGEFSSVKGSILFDRSKLCGHNSFLSSILGYEACMQESAAAIDTMPDGASIAVQIPEGVYDTKLTRLGAIICDGAKIGASCTINPGAVIDEKATVYPVQSISGYVYPYATKK